MAEDGRRPGGLTALAVVNFVYGGLVVLSGLLMALAIATIDRLPKEAADELRRIGVPMLWVATFLMLLQAGLLITSGVGYLKQRKVLGRVLGNVYALVALAGVVVEFAFGAGEMNFGTIIALVYPVLTLVLVNTTFRDDLVR